MARTSIDLRYIEDVQKRRACFSKRRQGLMKKAHELSVLCDADIGLIVFSDSHKLYEFASSDMTHIMMRYRAATHAPPLPPLEAQPDMSRCLEEKEAEIRSLKKKVMLLESEKDDEQGLSRLDNPKMEFRSAITRRPSKLSIMEIFGPEYLRRPTITDIEKLYAFHEEKHEFSEMLRSLDCTDWEWFGYPQAYKGQYVRRDHCPNPFILLEPQSQPPNLSRVTGTGHAVSRKPRVPGDGTHMAGQGAMDKEVVAVDGMVAEEQGGFEKKKSCWPWRICVDIEGNCYNRLV
ncbi:MADS-box transcription factor 25-like protein isoform X1 [Tanacetum coccineum]|uniref:MADS-box transcription factor 25-like protein isoform X1 n=1 Tax=Tanacetum coccineum TaxID=301880 RepID=A0ABQ5DIW8_9ASTR